MSENDVEVTRGDGSCFKAKLGECESWRQTRLGGMDLIPYWSRPGHRPPEPTLYRTASGEYFRRTNPAGRNDYECYGLTAVRQYIGLSKEEALEWLAENDYDSPAD